ncbi:SGNH/GDSL hydrolase family protein [Clostridium bowmanii]|uniref:SGNH/GDSL hydrolase family protein n=1 Tax=Clostridium bowmanii TaxID=132925 RepID=UPI001C0BE640|nr:SGNH/GDSL hydrolase family protein [Clostridium bowmanii]MBU3191837.1 SGNH/GDSL hydrolase family protein [Clostridium bowmanii]MCA1076173.1 SGNH/GDSL hydrolase family protein [Clostridium bowmanii]
MEKQKIFVIGDSVSIHYGPYLKNMIKHKFDYDRKRGVEEALEDLDKPVGANAGDSGMVMDYLAEEHKKNIKFDILLLNCGLHDARVDRDLNKVQVELEDYKMNLTKIIEISKTMSNKTIWIGLTPVIDEIHNSRKEGVLRYSKDIYAYDIAAKEIMEQYNIPYIDMYNFTKNLGTDIYSDHVHFKEEIRQLQAKLIADYLNLI